MATDNLRTGGSIIIFNAWRNMDAIAAELEACGCTVKEMIQWQKSNPMPRNRDRLYVTACEFAIWAVKGKGWTFNRQRSTYENTIFQYPIVSAKNRIHTTQKPVELMRDLIMIHSNEGDIVLDPFIGSGTTAVAALETGHKYIGYEIDERYYTAAMACLEQCGSIYTLTGWQDSNGATMEHQQAKENGLLIGYEDDVNEFNNIYGSGLFTSCSLE